MILCGSRAFVYLQLFRSGIESLRELHIYYREMRNISLFLLKYFALSQTPIPTTSTSIAMTTTVQSMAGNYSGVPTPRPTVNPNGFNPVFGNIFIVQTEYLRKWFLASVSSSRVSSVTYVMSHNSGHIKTILQTI